MIHVFGDSHADGFNGHSGYVAHIVGRCTAYNLINPNSTTQGGVKIGNIVSKLDAKHYLLFVFGEIDCRVHIYQKYMEHNQEHPLTKYITDTVTRYLDYVEQYKPRVIIGNIPPAGYEGNAFNYPFYGDPNIRAYINYKYNESLEKECNRRDIPFVSIYHETVLSDGLADKRYLRDSIHYNNKAVKLFTTKLREQLCVI